MKVPSSFGRSSRERDLIFYIFSVLLCVTDDEVSSLCPLFLMLITFRRPSQ